MTFATWIALLIAGPGALAIFAWFLHDVLRPRAPRDQSERKEDTTARTSSERSGSP